METLLEKVSRTETRVTMMLLFGCASVSTGGMLTRSSRGNFPEKASCCVASPKDPQAIIM